MTGKILVVTAPDDAFLQGIRITHVNLSEAQSSAVSEALLNSNTLHSVINYVWKSGDSKQWLFDKIIKSDLILFNAEYSSDDLVTGWIAARSNSYYFGNLKDLKLVNDNAIYSVEDVLTLLEKVSKNYETR